MSTWNESTSSVGSSRRLSWRQGRSLFGLAALGVAISFAIILRAGGWITSRVYHHSSVPIVTATEQDPLSVLLVRLRRELPLPSDIPRIERVTQIEVLRELNPSFYAEVKEMDWVLRFTSLLIVYRPDEDRIIRVGQ